jgi:hypothetical protein
MYIKRGDDVKLRDYLGYQLLKLTYVKCINFP